MAEKRVQELLGQMQKTLECSICLEMMTNPVSTGCGHQFCRFCLMKMLDKKRQVHCPLCKKPVTKRSLMKREQLGEMIDGVRSLISAFQKDTGELFSPPRGLQPSLLPGTPDVIHAKSAVAKKQGKETRQSNIRRTARKQPVESGVVHSLSAVESPDRIPNDTNVRPNNGIMKRNTRNKSKTTSETETMEGTRHLELLKCIEEGRHHADDSVIGNVVTDEGNSVYRIKTKSLNSSAPKTIQKTSGMLVNEKSCKKLETKLTDYTHQSNREILTNEISTNNVQNNSVEVTDNISEGCDDIGEDNDPDVPVLSGNSVAKESEASSGPLFKTPVDPKGQKHSEKEVVVSKHCQDIDSKKSLRSRNRIQNYDENVDKDECNSVNSTPEVLVVKESAVSRTYSRKDKDSFSKEKKVNKKVAEWLQNISAATESGRSKKSELRKGNKQKKLSRKSLKVVQEEEAMGTRMKNLAKQIQDNGKGLFFDSDDFELEENASAIINAASASDNEREQRISDADQDIESSKLKDETETNSENEIGMIETNAENDFSAENHSTVSELSAGDIVTEAGVVKNPARKKRIFKSRTTSALQSSKETATDRATVTPVSEKQIDISNPKLVDNFFDTNNVEIENQQFGSLQESFDPYEFKSSQNTPKKTNNKKKGNQKKTGKLTNKRKGKLKVAEGKIKADKIKEETDIDRNFEKVWDKDLIPDKTILKVKPSREIEKIAASLQLAESYDLLTCTQEAADSIAKEKEKQGANTFGEVVKKNETTSKLICAQKKVRFTEPVIKDFISVGKVDIIGYRKAKEQYVTAHSETVGKSDNQEALVKRIEKEKTDISACESPLGENQNNVVDEEESDDLSEDYRFHEDSSGTDDLDIEPTPEQFEKPNFEIQPEEIKSQLSQIVQDTVQETPLISVNQDSPNLNIIEETPAVFSGPKFNKVLSKPARKLQKSKNITKFSVRTKKKAVTETSETVTDEGRRVIDVSLVQGQTLGTEKNKDTKDAVLKQEKLKRDVEQENSKLLVDSDETKSPDEMNFAQDTSEKEVKDEARPFDNDQEIIEAAIQEVKGSESTLTQDSESILYPKIMPAKTSLTNNDRTNKNDEKHNQTSNTEINIKENSLEKDKVFEQMPEKRSNSDSSKNLIKPVNKTRPKKKRKSFMLEEAEESLDFGSLSESVVVSVDEDSESVSKAKRQRLNRLRRSPKNKQSVSRGKAEDGAFGSEADINGTEKESESVEMIPDTVASDSTVSEYVKPEKIVHDSNLSLQAVGLSCQSVSLQSSNIKLTETKEQCKSKKVLGIEEEEGYNYQESHQRNVNDSLETVDRIGETEMSNTEDLGNNEMKEKIKNNDEGKIYCKTSNKNREINCHRSPSEGKKKLKQLESDLNGALENVVEVRNLNGMFISPQKSLVLTDVKDSPEDIFRIDAEMPTVDFSPDEGILKLSNCSQSLDLGTLESLVPVSHVELTSHEKQEVITNINKENILIERSQPDDLILTPTNKKETETQQGVDSSPEEMKKKSKVKAVRGFSKKKIVFDTGQSPLSSLNSNQRTPQSVTTVKSKSPVAKFLSPKLRSNESFQDKAELLSGKKRKHVDPINMKERASEIISNLQQERKQRLSNTPLKKGKDKVVSKHSPPLLKKIEMKSEHEQDIVALKTHADKDEVEEFLLSPNDLNDLPDLDNGNDNQTSVDINFSPIMIPDVITNNDELLKGSKISPKLLLKSPKKEMNVMLQSDFDEVEKNYIAVDRGNENGNPSKEESDEESVISKRQSSKSSFHIASVDENSLHSSASSEFRIDSPAEEESPKQHALTEISKFNKIVEKSMELDSCSDMHRGRDYLIRNTQIINENYGKKKCQRIEMKSDEYRESIKQILPADHLNNEKATKMVPSLDSKDIYSTRLDSSPSIEDDNIVGDSEPVILESDIDDDDDVADDDFDKNRRQHIDSDNGYVDTESTMEHSDTVVLQTVNDDDDDDNSDEAVVRRKGVKRAIISDSSSDDEDEDSRHMSIASSSAFSSQSENLTTQERNSLEKEVERMAREMQAMKEQLRRSKEMKQSKKSESKPFPKPVTVDDSGEDMIDTDYSDKDEDMFMSPPAICPSDLQQDEETMNPMDIYDIQDDVVEQDEAKEEDEAKEVDESVTMPPDSLIVPESDPSQLSRQALADLDTNVPQTVTPSKKRHIGIVVTGLTQQQIQQTKKLAALNDVKFFTRFNDEVTHVVVKPADEDDTVCDRTLKFFQGISRKCFIVNYFWVVDSRQIGYLLPEGPYEIQGDTANSEAHNGPRRARLSQDFLFCKFQFSLIGDNTYLSKDSLKDLIEACGGDVIDIADLGQGHRKPLVISCTDIDEDAEEQQLITKHAKDLYKGLGVVTLTREWILDGLTMYMIQPLEAYVITNCPNTKLPEI